MPRTILCHSPGACSEVSLNALEECGLPYELKLVNLMKGEQSGDAYLAVSPLGKVPSLLVDDDIIIENAAIIVYIHAIAPQGGIFPAAPAPRMLADMQAGLSFCGGTLHPLVRGIANPFRITTGDVEPVREMALKLAGKSFAYAEKRLAERGWWLGQWSIIDVYLNWAFSVALRGPFDPAPFPHLQDLKRRLMERPAFARVQAINAQARETLGY